MTDIIDATFKENTDIAKSEGLGRVDQALLDAKDFERLKARLLDRAKHVNSIGGKDRVNGAGWDLIAGSMGISVSLLSKGSDGAPGARRELLALPGNKSLVSYSIALRAEMRGRVVDMTGRCDSSETKHNQYEHKMERVAYTRAKNQAICQMVGGSPGDIADDMEDMVDTSRRRRATEEDRQIPIARLIELHRERGCPNGKLGKWLVEAIPGFNGKQLTRAQSVAAYALLEEMIP